MIIFIEWPRHGHGIRGEAYDTSEKRGIYMEGALGPNISACTLVTYILFRLFRLGIRYFLLLLIYGTL